LQVVVQRLVKLVTVVAAVRVVIDPLCQVSLRVVVQVLNQQ
jgi:hypothetical protein